jgi:hypothetical protein
MEYDGESSRYAAANRYPISRQNTPSGRKLYFPLDSFLVLSGMLNKDNFRCCDSLKAARFSAGRILPANGMGIPYGKIPLALCDTTLWTSNPR